MSFDFLFAILFCFISLFLSVGVCGGPAKIEKHPRTFCFVLLCAEITQANCFAVLLIHAEGRTAAAHNGPALIFLLAWPSWCAAAGHETSPVPKNLRQKRQRDLLTKRRRRKFRQSVSS